MLAGQLLAKNAYTEFHEIPSNSSVAGIKRLVDTRDMVSKERLNLSVCWSLSIIASPCVKTNMSVAGQDFETRCFLKKKKIKKMKIRGHFAGTQTCKLCLLLECLKVHGNTTASTALLARQMPFMRSAIVQQIAPQPHLSVFCDNQNVAHSPATNSVLYSASWAYTRYLF